MAAATVHPLSILLTARDEVSGTLTKLEGRLGAFGKRTTKVGKDLTKALTLPLTLLGGGILKASASFEKAMNNVAAVTGTVGQPAFQTLRETALELGKTTPFSATQAADAMGILGQASQDAATIIGTIPTTLELAAAGDLELAESADIATAILKSQREGTELLDLRTNQLVRTSLSAKTSIAQLGDGFRQSGDAAKGAGQTFETTLTLLAGFAEAGKRGSEGGVALRNMIARLLDVTPKMAAVFEDLKIQPDQIFSDDGGLRDLLSILSLLEQRGATAQQLAQLFGTENFSPILGILQKGTGTLQEFAGGLDEVSVAGARAEYAAVRMAGASGGIAGFWSALEGLAIAVGDSGLLEWFTAAVRWAGDFARSLSQSSPQTLKWASILGIAAAAVGPFLVVLGQASTGLGVLIKYGRLVAPVLGTIASTLFGTVIPATIAWGAALLANPIFWIGAAIAGVTVGVIYLAKHWDKTVAVLKKGLNLLFKPAKLVLGWIDEKLGAIAKFLVPPWMRWLINKFSGGDEPIAAAEIAAVDERAASVAAGGAPLSSFSETRTTTTNRLQVDMTNVPRGTTIRTEGANADSIDLAVGYSMEPGL